ncbi:hypothetical protein chiPu_0015083 [Chiloscyllium punctatum]|uniref:Uncharacterized protein n=1 Tax=Chiloscyllium punctatum TaxID=137246 RepID=A0A401T1U3_CHIPU|nr:hypothetical protein [Chiloscyllium punctatum]
MRSEGYGKGKDTPLSHSPSVNTESRGGSDGNRGDTEEVSKHLWKATKAEYKPTGAVSPDSGLFSRSGSSLTVAILFLSGNVSNQRRHTGIKRS